MFWYVPGIEWFERRYGDGSYLRFLRNLVIASFFAGLIIAPFLNS